MYVCIYVRSTDKTFFLLASPFNLNGHLISLALSISLVTGGTNIWSPPPLLASYPPSTSYPPLPPTPPPPPLYPLPPSTSYPPLPPTPLYPPFSSHAIPCKSRVIRTLLKIPKDWRPQQQGEIHTLSVVNDLVCCLSVQHSHLTWGEAL